MSKSRIDLLNYFYEYVTPNKKQKIEQVSAKRTKHITVALEDMAESKDASGLIRSCECFGIQNVHIIENKSKYKVNRAVGMGSFKWIDLFYYKTPDKSLVGRLSEEDLKDTTNTEKCIETLKKDGYKVVAMSSKAEISIQDLDYNDKLAFLFGSENYGLSDYAIENADIIARVPSYGQTKSYNLSVSGALTVYNAIETLIAKNIDFYIKDEELLELKIRWVKKVIKEGYAKYLEIKFNL